MNAELRKQLGIKPIGEKEFQDQVLVLAARLGWLRFHARPARTARGWRTPLIGDNGFPDLVLARGGRVIFAELKDAKGRPTAEQAIWLAELRKCSGCEAYLWRPDDWELIRGILQRC